MRPSKTLPSIALALALLLLCATAASAGGRKRSSRACERLRPAGRGHRDGGRRRRPVPDPHERAPGRSCWSRATTTSPTCASSPSGVVQENRRSPSKYVNDDRFGLTPGAGQRELGCHAGVAAGLPERHVPVVRPPHALDGQGDPAQVKDPASGPRSSTGRVPMEVGGAPVAALGTLAVGARRRPRPTAASRPARSSRSSRPCSCCSAALAYLLSRRRRRRCPPRPASGPRRLPSEQPRRRKSGEPPRLLARGRVPRRCSRSRRRPRRSGTRSSRAPAPLSGRDGQAPARPDRVPLQRAGRGQLRRHPRLRQQEPRASTAASRSTPAGEGSRLAVRLKPELPKGTYTATYRVISADSHPVSGGFVFSDRPAVGGRRDRLGPAQGPRRDRRRDRVLLRRHAHAPVRGDRDRDRRRLLPARDLAAGARLGGRRGRRVVARVGAVRRAAEPAARAGRRGRRRQLGARHRLPGRDRGRACRSGARSTGTSSTTCSGTRFGTVWGIRLLVWLALGGLLVAAFSGARRPVLRPASVGATGPGARAAGPAQRRRSRCCCSRSPSWPSRRRSPVTPASRTRPPSCSRPTSSTWSR